MLIREYTVSDLDALRAIHAAQGFDYTFPDLSNPLFVSKLVLTEDPVAQAFTPQTLAGSKADGPCGSTATPGCAPNSASGNDKCAQARVPVLLEETSNSSDGRIVGAALLRLTAEAYLLLDPRAGAPRERWNWLLALHAATERDAWRRGLEDVHAWLPPRLAAGFARRLERLGWRRDDSWTPYCKHLTA